MCCLIILEYKRCEFFEFSCFDLDALASERLVLYGDVSVESVLDHSMSNVI